MKRCEFKKARDCDAREAGFTLIELLVVVGIMVLLIAILVPTMSLTRAAARKAATQQTLATIDQGLQGYFNAFTSYPPSTPGATNFNGANLNRGGNMLAEGLAGYLDYAYDGAGPGNSPPDPLYGFRTKTGGYGPVYGPYVNPTNKTWRMNNGNPLDQVLIDGYGNEILYYRSTQAVAPALRPVATLVFGSVSNSLFVITDNSAAFNADGVTAIADPSVDLPAPLAKPKFWAQIGTANNTLSTGIVQGRDTYLLVSAGPDGIFFSNDDVLSGR